MTVKHERRGKFEFGISKKKTVKQASFEGLKIVEAHDSAEDSPPDLKEPRTATFKPLANKSDSVKQMFEAIRMIQAK